MCIKDRYYDGIWKDEKIHGKGLFVYDKVQNYRGQYNMGMKHGFGEMVYADGRIYRGNFLNGEEYGEGKMISTGPEGKILMCRDGKVLDDSWD